MVSAFPRKNSSSLKSMSPFWSLMLFLQAKTTRYKMVFCREWKWKVQNGGRLFCLIFTFLFHFQVTFPDAANVKLTMTVVRVEEHDFSLKLETFKLAEDLFVSSFGHSKAIEMSYDRLFQAQCERSKQIRDRSLPFPSPQTNVSCYDSVTDFEAPTYI